MKNFLCILILNCFIVFSSNAKKVSQVQVEIRGYEGRMVYFDFVEKDNVDKEFPYFEGQEMAFDVELEDITMMKINDWIQICLEPGDCIQAKIQYEGKRCRNIEYAGTPQAVAVGNYFQEIYMLRAQRRFRTNIPTLLVLNHDAKDYHALVLQELKDELEILDKIKPQISTRMYNYLRSELEATLLSNMITYPYASASFHKKSLDSCLADGYWHALDNYQLRDDEASLRNRLYMAFLIDYKDYEMHKMAFETGEDYSSQKSVEKEYQDLVSFYKGNMRDAALFVFLCNQVMVNKDLKVVSALKKDYLKKYNKNKEYRQILTRMDK